MIIRNLEYLRNEFFLYGMNLEIKLILRVE